MITIKFLSIMEVKFKKLIEASIRYPLTLLFLVASTIVNIVSINSETEELLKLTFTFLVGAFVSALAQHIYERFFTRTNERTLLMLGSIIFSVLFFFAIHPSSNFNIETSTKTGITMFALLMGFIWVPSIKNKLTFNKSFMSAFKAFFTTILFTLVIAGGISLVIFTVDNLLFSVNDKTIPHALIIVLGLFSPIFFLSFIPAYLGKKDNDIPLEELQVREHQIEKAIACPTILEILISYIIIPLTAIYTIILITYILLNLDGEFWTKNLMEPLLVSYTITVLIVYLLASNLENKFASFFRMIFPKVLVPIVLFQTIASILKISEMGITHGRYYVILFGFYAIVIGLIFSFLPIRKNGLLVPILIVLSAISITPPIDAFTVSRSNQIHLLEKTLESNNMFENNKIIPNSTVSIEDKRVITQTVSYLDNMSYTNKIDWLSDYSIQGSNFEGTFGFNPIYALTDEESTEPKFATLNWEDKSVLNIGNPDYLTHMYINSSMKEVDADEPTLIENGMSSYRLIKQLSNNNYWMLLENENSNELIKVDLLPILKSTLDSSAMNNNTLSIEKAFTTHDSEQVKMSILVNTVDFYGDEYNADIYIFVTIK
ncbi:DUF4153 domain-containing protein [Sporosarcina sp. CAU 1771]